MAEAGTLFPDVPTVYFFTYVDKDGYVPESVRGGGKGREPV